ncbi:hypothetical protein [Larkinella rosea]|uniref:Lipocalin-like domain-containing protein n=1 Tax=Larkinella rosea TaxID=2025312 RepID=A0A3P1C1A2_9BACT|nr:hypothetical protein [Larkinella rosea]RRB07200.1 hypothetical protein EHT25_05305 [Larkinella rosea]
MKKALLFLLLGTAVFVSCSKDDDSTPAVKTKAEMIVNTWEVQTGSVGLGSATPINGYTKGGSANLLDMSKFRMQFKTGGDFVQTSLEGVSTTGKWALSDNDTKLTLTTAALPAPDVWNITTLTETNFDFGRTIAGNSTAAGDLYWKNLIDTYGKPVGITSANGVTIAVKTVPVK